MVQTSEELEQNDLYELYQFLQRDVTQKEVNAYLLIKSENRMALSPPPPPPPKEHLTLEGKHSTLAGKHPTLAGKHSTLAGKHPTLAGKHSTLAGKHSTLVGKHPTLAGLWEAAVKSAKFHLKRVIRDQKLHYEEFATVTAQVEACLIKQSSTTSAKQPLR